MDTTDLRRMLAEIHSHIAHARMAEQALAALQDTAEAQRHTARARYEALLPRIMDTDVGTHLTRAHLANLAAMRALALANPPSDTNLP
jgi:hypothetical protein